MTLTRSFPFRPRRLALLSLAALFLSGCASFTADDPRSNYRHDLWWLGAESPNSMRWPAREVKELDPMPVESIPERNPPSSKPSPGWPPL
jgi:PBP1b-binding outer membrane lipoprotein LpoB